MAYYRSTDQHLTGSEPVERAAFPHLADPRLSHESGPIVGDQDHHLRAALARARSWLKPLLATLAVVTAIAGLLFILASEAYGVRPNAAFPCPPETSAAVQAATGCVLPARDEDSWTGLP